MAQAAGYIPTQHHGNGPAMKAGPNGGMAPPAPKEWPRPRQDPRGTAGPGTKPPIAPPAAAAGAAGAAAHHQKKQQQQAPGQQQQQQHHKVMLPRLGKSLDERLRRDTPFMCNIRFKNDLPEIPSDPKMLVAELDGDKLGSYFSTQMEKDSRRLCQVLFPADLGVPISLMDLEAYSLPQGSKPEMAEPDKKLIVECVSLQPSKTQDSNQFPRAQAVEVSWLMRTTYLSAHDNDKKAAKAAKPKAGVSPAAAAAAAEMDEEQRRERQIQEIEHTFQALARPPRHPKNPHLTPVEVLPVLPDFDSWADKFVSVLFEGDPGLDSKQLAAIPDADTRRELVERSMLKTYRPRDDVDDGRPCMALLLPERALQGALSGAALPPGLEVSDLEGPYKWDSEYICKVEQQERDASNMATYVMQVYEDRVGYCPFEAKLKLRKRQRAETDAPQPEKVNVRTRPFLDDEEQDRVQRMTEFEPEGGMEEQLED